MTNDLFVVIYRFFLLIGMIKYECSDKINLCLYWFGGIILICKKCWMHDWMLKWIYVYIGLVGISYFVKNVECMLKC